MNWEKSKALTPLERDFLEVFFALEKRFFLTGGAALGIFYLQHRVSYDLDLFTTEQADWHEVENECRECASRIGATARSITASPLFRRLEIVRGGEREVVDLVAEKALQIDECKNEFGSIRVDTLREIGVNKITMLVSRCEPKDLFDLFCLEKHGFIIEDHFDEAKRKEGGMDPATIAYVLSETEPDASSLHLLMPLASEELQRYHQDLKKRMSAMAFPDPPRPRDG